ncbi:hypothetical protein DBR32_03255 [Taibaiella sp. KBW10]|nr:hypothetical protein DBR32_03255 [Taibaiella sp. KBW10]
MLNHKIIIYVRKKLWIAFLLKKTKFSKATERLAYIDVFELTPEQSFIGIEEQLWISYRN